MRYSFQPRRPRLRSLLSLVTAMAIALLCLGLSPSSAAAQNGPGVVYQYETIQLGNTAQYMLVPHALETALSGDLETDVRAAFQALRRGARVQMYGGTSLDIDPAQLKKGKLAVKVDTALTADYALIIQGEIVHTMASLGITEVAFSGAVSETLTVADVPFAAFTPTVPLWRALPPATLEGGLVRLPGGDVVAVESFQQRLDKKDAGAVKAVYQALHSSAPLSRKSILERLPALGLDDWQAEVLKRLKDDHAEVRLAAVNALKGAKDKDALEALVAVLDKDKDAGVQAAAATVLSSSGDKKYGAYGIYFALRGEDETAALAAIDELVKQRVDAASDELLKALAHSHRAVGMRAASALGELGQDRALRQALGDDKLDLEVREHVALALGALTDKDAAFAGRSWLAAHGDEVHALAAIEKLAAARDPEPLGALGAALDSPHRAARIAAARALATLKDDDSLKALASAAGKHVDERIEIEDAMVDLLEAAESLSGLEDRTKKEKNALLRRATFRALGRKAAAAGRMAQVRDKLIAGLDDGDEQARGGALLGLAEEPNEENMALIATRSSEPAAQVRMDVALALGRYEPGQATDVLLLLARDTSADVAIAAVRSFGQRAEATVVRDLVKLGKDEPRLRIALIRNLPLLITPDTRADVVAYISNLLFDQERSVKLAAIEGLGRISDDQSLSSLAMLVQDPDKEIQFATFGALAAGKHADAVALLGKGLEADDVEVRKAAVEALGRHAGQPVRGVLEAFIERETDPGIKTLAEKTLGQLR